MNRPTEALTAIVKRFQGQDIRIVDYDQQNAIVAADVADVLDYQRTSDLLNLVRDKYKGAAVARTPGGEQNVTVIVEAGLWQALAKTRKPKAEPFQDWLYETGLPNAARNTGVMEQQTSMPPELAEAMLQSQQMMQQMMQTVAATGQAASEANAQANEAKQIASEAKQEMQETLEARSIADDCDQRTWQEMRDEIEDLRKGAMARDGSRDHVAYWHDLYADLRSFHKVNINRLVQQRNHDGAKIQCLTREEMRLALDSAIALWE